MATAAPALKLTNDNYHSLEANQLFMSRGQYNDFLACEAMAMAKVNGTYQEEERESLLAGRMFHAWNHGPDQLAEFFAKHRSDICKRDGELKAPFVKVQSMIDCLRMDPFAMWVLQGQKEVILTAFMFGCWWKVQIDSLNREQGRLVELKSAKSIRAREYDRELREWVSFIEYWKYPRQAAIYTEVERLASGRGPGEYLEPIVVVASKEDPPDKEIISLKEPDRYAAELREIEKNMPRILAVKAGKIEPARCGCCAYCRLTKKLDHIVFYREFE